jgi:hypothetical protein
MKNKAQNIAIGTLVVTILTVWLLGQVESRVESQPVTHEYWRGYEEGYHSAMRDMEGITFSDGKNITNFSEL